MKIKEIIELSKTDSLAKIAKEHLNVGKEKAREGLKQAGCYSKNGLKGWHFDGDESVLEQSIYDFVTTTRQAKSEFSTAKKEASSAIEEPRLVNIPTSQQNNKTENKKINKPINKQRNKQVGKSTNQLSLKKVTYEIEEQLHDELKIKAIREKRTVSEIVNEIIKKGLN